jgi:hypothetical protein
MEEVDLESRELCPDGACIGVLGPDRVCKVCGLTAEGTYNPSAIRAAAHDDDDDDDGDHDADDDDSDSAGDEDSDGADDSDDKQAKASDDALEDRKLCPDGTCIGVIGEDGRCKVCGAVGR